MSNTGSLYVMGDVYEGEIITSCVREVDSNGFTKHVEVYTATKIIFVIDPSEVYVDG